MISYKDQYQVMHGSQLTPELEVKFRQGLRRQMVLPRTMLFIALAVGFGFAPFYNEALFHPSTTVLPLLISIELVVVLPILLLAAGTTYFSIYQLLTQAIQTAAVFVTLSAVLLFRYLSLRGDMLYPSDIVGLILIAVAFFGGFNRHRIVRTSVLFVGSAIALEFWMATPASIPLQHAYGLFLMGIIAALGSATHEELTHLVWREMQKLRDTKATLLESQQRFEAFMDHMPSIAWLKDSEGRYVYRNRAHRDRCGSRGENWIGRSDKEFFPEIESQQYEKTDQQVIAFDQTVQFETTNISGEDELTNWWVQKFPIQDAAGQSYIAGIGTDITERKKAEELVRLQSLTDEMTGLYNRRGFSILVDQEIKHARRMNLRCALLYVDLDGLKKINELHGHEGGDMAITSVGEALRVAARESDIVARVGGDEFLVFAIDCADAQVLKKRLLDTVKQYNVTASLPFTLSVSIGISEFAADEGISIENEIIAADKQMFDAKGRKIPVGV
jgi:diguanylate cyclase (GGDEF)-like protein/PAS domain S-box-containing protein